MKKYFLPAIVALSLGFVSCTDDEPEDPQIKQYADSQPSAVKAAKGFYVANEDWFGHDNGTVNYFKVNGTGYDVVYRAYRAANEGETLGVTTEFGTTWGSYVYLLSKQGNRLVVADANTLKKKAVFTDIGGDGRAFVGVDDQVGYVSHSAGVRRFDIANLQLGDPVEGVTGQVGTMCYAEGRLFALTQKKVYVIDVATNKIEQAMTGTFNALTRSKDGIVWVATSTDFLKINPRTLEEQRMAYPEGIKIGGSWSAWNAGSFCASTQENVLYWGHGKSTWSITAIAQYNIDTQAFNSSFYTLGKHEDKQLSLYAAGIRVDPLTDRVVATVTRGYENFNWVYLIAPNGTLEKEIVVNGGQNSEADGYYWFPAVPFFEDANKPEILTNQILLASNETQTIDLTEKMIDADNTALSIIREVEFADNDLVTSSLKGNVLTVTSKGGIGSTTCKFIAISNGEKVEKTVRVDVVLKK